MKRNRPRLSRRTFWVLCALLVCLRLTLTGFQQAYIWVGGAPLDDELMFRAANSITAGQWLGAYDYLTLSKAMFFPVWLALLHALHLPYLISGAALWCGAALTAAFAFSPLWRKKDPEQGRVLTLALFAVLAFLPSSWASYTLRVYRDNIFPALCLYFFVSYVSMGLSTLISLIYTPIMLGRLGETEYGVYGAVGPIISYLLLLSMGLGSAYIRYYSQAKVAKDRREMAKLNGMFLVTLSLLGLVLLALGFFLAAHPQMVFGTKWAPEELALGAKLLRIMTLNAALSFPFSVFESHVNIHERYLFLKAVTMAKSVLSPLISIPLLLLGFRSPAIATLSLVLTIVCGLTYMAYCFAVLKMPVSFRTYDLPLMKSMMGFTFYIFLAVVVDQLNYGIGTLMTTWIHGAELSGVYYSANQLNVYYLSFAMAISNVLIPRVHRMVAEGDSNRELTRLMTKAGRLQFIMLMAVFLGFVAVGRPFVILWAGGKEQFAVDYPVALLLFASTIVSAIQFVGLEILRAKNMHRFRAWVYLAAAAVNVGLMIPLCKYGGLVGVAGSILFITVVGNVLPINWYFRRHVGLDVRWFWVHIARLLPSMLVPAIVAVLIAVLAPVSGYLDILIWGCVFVAVYAASLWLFGMNRYERGIVTGVLDKFRRKRRRRA